MFFISSESAVRFNDKGPVSYYSQIDNIEIFGISDFEDLESIVIYSVLGQKIVDYKSGSYSNNSGMVLNVSDLSNGTYLLKICCKTCFKILKFQK